MSKPPIKLLLTPGEPAGVGPELCVRTAQQAHPFVLCAVADPQLLSQAAEQLALPLKITSVDNAEPLLPSRAGEIYVLPVPLATAAEPGKLNVANANYVLTTLGLA